MNNYSNVIVIMVHMYKHHIAIHYVHVCRRAATVFYMRTYLAMNAVGRATFLRAFTLMTCAVTADSTEACHTINAAVTGTAKL